MIKRILIILGMGVLIACDGLGQGTVRQPTLIKGEWSEDNQRDLAEVELPYGIRAVFQVRNELLNFKSFNPAFLLTYDLDNVTQRGVEIGSNAAEAYLKKVEKPDNDFDDEMRNLFGMAKVVIPILKFGTNRLDIVKLNFSHYGLTNGFYLQEFIFESEVFGFTNTIRFTKEQADAIDKIIELRRRELQ